MSTTLLGAWTATVRANPGAVALIDASTNRQWSRAEIEGEAEAWQNRNGEVALSQTIAFANANGVEWLRVFLGVLKCGAVAVPLDPGEPVEVQRVTAKHAGASYLWCNGELEAIAPRTRAPRDRRRLIKL